MYCIPIKAVNIYEYMLPRYVREKHINEQCCLFFFQRGPVQIEINVGIFDGKYFRADSGFKGSEQWERSLGLYIKEV